MYIVHSPFSLPQTKKKSFSFNLNVYRNTHYKTLNTMKVRYKEYMRPQIEGLPNFKTIILKIVIYPKTKRKFDVGNIGSITEKFFADALVELGKLPDDNYEHLPAVAYTFGNVDKINPRIEIQIHEI